MTLMARTKLHQGPFRVNTAVVAIVRGAFFPIGASVWISASKCGLDLVRRLMRIDTR